MEEMIEKYYEEFRGLPNGKAIVRENTLNDAFTLVVLDILYGKELNFTIDTKNLSKIEKMIVAPPDGGIDLFIEHEDGDERDIYETQIKTYNRQLEINNICLFYNVALYYEFKNQFKDKEDNKVFKYDLFYADKNFRESLIIEYANKFLTKTIELIKLESEFTANMGNWIKSAKNQDNFMKKLRNDLAIKLDYETEFEDFVNKFKE